MPLAGRPTVHPRLLDAAARYYPHTVTIQERTTQRDAWGAVVETWTDLAGYVDIPARVVPNGPGTGTTGWSGERDEATGDYGFEGLTMALRGHYPSITESHRVVWDGLVFDIDVAESDAEGVTTRLRTRRVG